MFERQNVFKKKSNFISVLVNGKWTAFELPTIQSLDNPFYLLSYSRTSSPNYEIIFKHKLMSSLELCLI